MRAGRLDRRVTLQRFTSTTSPSGEPIEQWEAISHKRPARVTDLRGDERYTADQLAARQQAVFEIRYASVVADLNPLDRLIYPAPESGDVQEPPVHTIWDIMAVSEIGRRVGLRISAARRAEGGN